MHTPGPWRSIRTGTCDYYVYQIEIAEGHIASIAGWMLPGTVCAVTEANARLIEHAPDLAAALRDLLAWCDQAGGWEALCWTRAQRVLDHATAASSPSHGPVTPARVPPSAATRQP